MDTLIFGIAGFLGLILLAVIASSFSEERQKRKPADKQPKSIGERKNNRSKMAEDEYFSSAETRQSSQLMGQNRNTPVL